MTIYRFTKQKLITHGVENSVHGRTILNDKALFLLFVKLERARRLADFCVVELAVADIDSYLKRIGKRQLLIYAFMYIRFTDITPHNTSIIRLDGEGGRLIKDYRRSLSQEEIAIGEWAISMSNRYRRRLFPAVYSGAED
jgi:hypothetical protein